MEFKIEKKEGFEVIGYSIRTTEENNAHYHDIGKLWGDYLKDDSMWNRLLPYAANPDEGYSYAVSSYDGNSKAPAFRYTVGVPYNGAANNDNLTVIRIPAGSYAIFQLPAGEEVGAYTERIFREWLPASGYQLTGGPELELSSSKDNAFVWLPVKEG